MTENVNVYEDNLAQRLDELRQGDPAYELHKMALYDALIHAHELHGAVEKPRVLDCGCGLGFLAAGISRLCSQVVAIDPSEKAIALARQEHPEVSFYAESAELFAKKMSKLGIDPFDQVILNMVLHSVNDSTALNILIAVRKCLVSEGTVIMLVPDKAWLMQKLIEYAQDQGMERGPGILWVRDQLSKPEIELPIRLRRGQYYPTPLTVYNRKPEDYGNFLRLAGFGVRWEIYDAESERLTHSVTVPYLDMDDYTSTIELNGRRRKILMSFAFPPEVLDAPEF